MAGKYGQAEFNREYNADCGIIFREERRKRNLSLEEISSGIMSKTALSRMESGEIGWRKLAGDTLFLRLGIVPDYFEMVASGDELERWRLREDICLLIPGKAGEAGEKLREYRDKFQRREPLEEQFLRKAELLLCFQDGVERGERKELPGDKRFLNMAKEAVSCTVPGDWENDLDKLQLAPTELEAILLVGAAKMGCGRKEEAWEVWCAVWKYPETHLWRERITAMLKPQAALLGMELALREGDGPKAFSLGKEATELLRRNYSQCYLLPLLKMLGRIPEEGLRKEEREYLKEMAVFRSAFETMYEQTGYPGDRIWQGISVENTRETGIVLKMLRKFAGKPRAAAIYDGQEMVVTPRQLEKIENGDHKPSYENYQKLIRQYGKYGGWMIPMLETDSVEVLELRQEIASLIGFCEWEKAGREMERLRWKVNMEYPRIKQEFLLYEALLAQEQEGDLEKSLELLKRALHVTVPDVGGKDLKWWVFQREEFIIACNIMDTYRELGKIEKAGEWCEIIRFSMGQLCERTKVPHIGYAILMEGYDNYLGELEKFEEAVAAGKEAVCNYLKRPRIDTFARAFYRIAWNTYEMFFAQGTCNETSEEQWRDAFQISEALAEFTYDDYLVKFLGARRDKFLS